MKRKIVLLVLGLGAIGGYAAGFAGLSCRARHGEGRRAAFERHVAEVCLEAARQADHAGAASPARPAGPAGQRDQAP